MQVLLLTILLLLLPVWASAAYQNPVVDSNVRQPDGRTKLTFRFNGGAGEPTVLREFIVLSGTTPTIVRNWIDATLNELDLMHTAASLPSVQPGQTVTRLAPVAPTPTAKAVWRRKVEWYKHFSGYGFTGAMATDLAAIKADIEATYQAGFLLDE